MLRLESVAIALLGAVLGVALGLVAGSALQRSLADDGIDVLAIPGLQLAIFVVVAGFVGSSPPCGRAARAARLDVLQAITTVRGPPGDRPGPTRARPHAPGGPGGPGIS